MELVQQINIFYFQLSSTPETFVVDLFSKSMKEHVP